MRQRLHLALGILQVKKDCSIGHHLAGRVFLTFLDS